MVNGPCLYGFVIDCALEKKLLWSICCIYIRKWDFWIATTLDTNIFKILRYFIWVYLIFDLTVAYSNKNKKYNNIYTYRTTSKYGLDILFFQQLVTPTTKWDLRPYKISIYYLNFWIKVFQVMNFNGSWWHGCTRHCALWNGQYPFVVTMFINLWLVTGELVLE